jgi:hypothetical protein
MRVRDLAGAPDTDPVLRSALQLAFQHFEAAEAALLAPENAGRREHLAGQAFALATLLKTVEQLRAAYRAGLVAAQEKLDRKK